MPTLTLRGTHVITHWYRRQMIHVIANCSYVRPQPYGIIIYRGVSIFFFPVSLTVTDNARFRLFCTCLRMRAVVQRRRQFHGSEHILMRKLRSTWFNATQWWMNVPNTLSQWPNWVTTVIKIIDFGIYTQKKLTFCLRTVQKPQF